jgi:signal peptidase I
MNILRNLLFSFEGKIGRADYIYGLIYIVMLFLVSVDAFVYPNSIYLFWRGIDFVQILIYLASIIGLWLFIIAYIAITSKRARALNIETRWTILGIMFPPLLLVGFMEDSEKYEYVWWLSIIDQIFFYVVLICFIVCLFVFYEIQSTLRFILFVAIVVAGFSAYLFWKDKYPLRMNLKLKYTWIDAWIDLCFVLLIVFFIRSYVISPFQIIGPSMESTFHWGNINYAANWQQYGDGEFILVDKMTYRLSKPIRGDVVVFSPWIGPKKRYLIKRVIGIPGDTIKIEGGYVFLATKENPDKFIQLDESDYLAEKFGYTCLTYNSAWCAKESQQFPVPAGKYFLMGDNRPQSLDARKCFSNSGCNGEYTLAQYVPISRIQGRVAYSLGHFDIFSQILPYPKIGTLKSVIPYRGLSIQNTHQYPELSQ